MSWVENRAAVTHKTLVCSSAGSSWRVLLKCFGRSGHAWLPPLPKPQVFPPWCHGCDQGVFHPCAKRLLLGHYTSFIPCQKEKIKSELSLLLVVVSVSLVAAGAACNWSWFGDGDGRSGMENHGSVSDGTGSGILSDKCGFEVMSFAALIILLRT